MNSFDQSEPNPEVGWQSPELPLAGADPYFSAQVNQPSGPIPFFVTPDQRATSELADQTTGDHSLDDDSDFVAERSTDIRTYATREPQAQPKSPMPIRGALNKDTGGPCLAQPAAIPTTGSGEGEMINCLETIDHLIEQDVDGKFAALPGSVIEIDGNEGFDYLDLSDRDVASVTFGDGFLVVNEATPGHSFTVRYENVSRALFANGQMINLP
jgi:hypothetical protein